MKNVYYSIQYTLNNNTYSLMDQYLFSELAEKEVKRLNNTSEKSYFVGLQIDDIEKDYNYKGYYIIKTEKGIYKVFKNEDGKRTYISWSGSLKAAKGSINTNILASKLAVFIKGIKKYRPYSLANLTVEKTFNNGNGSLALFRLLPKEKKIKVNSSLATKSDFQKLADLQKYLGINFEVIKYNYYYPEYYNHSF